MKRVFTLFSTIPSFADEESYCFQALGESYALLGASRAPRSALRSEGEHKVLHLADGFGG